MIDYSKLSKLNTAQTRRGTSPTIQRVVAKNVPAVELRKDVRSRNIEAAKRIVEQAKSQSSTASSQGGEADSDAKSNSDDSRPWKIMIGVGVGIAIVTAVGYYALKE